MHLPTRKMLVFRRIITRPRPFMILKIMLGTHGSSTGILALACNHLLACVLLRSSHSGAETSRRSEDGGAKTVRRSSSLGSPPSQAVLSISLILNSTRGSYLLRAAKKSACFSIDACARRSFAFFAARSTRAIAAGLSVINSFAARAHSEIFIEVVPCHTQAHNTDVLCHTQLPLFESLLEFFVLLEKIFIF